MNLIGLFESKGLNNEENKSRKYNLISQVICRLIQIDNSMSGKYLSLIESRKDIRIFEYSTKLFKCFFKVDEVCDKYLIKVIRKFFFIEDGKTVLKTWLSAVEGREIVRKLYSTGYLELPGSLARAFDLKNGDYVKVTVEINNKDFSFFAKLKKGKKLYILVRAGTYSSLGLKPGDYVRISRDISDANIYTKSKAKIKESIRVSFASEIDGDFIRTKLGSNSNFGVLKYGKVLEFDKNGNPKALSSVKYAYVVRDINSSRGCRVQSRGPGTYVIDLIKITSESINDSLMSSEVKIPMEYDLQKRNVMMKFGDVFLEGTPFKYNPNIIINDEFKGGLRATLMLDNEKEIAVDLFADPETGSLKTKYSISLDFRDQHWNKVLDFYSCPEENKITIIYSRAEGDIRSITMEWNKALKRFINVEHSFLEIEKAVLEDLDGSIINKLETTSEVPDVFYDYVKKYEIVKMNPRFKYSLRNALSLDTNEKGILSTEILRKYFIEKLRSAFGIPERVVITIDKSGTNRGKYWFDLMAVDMGNQIIYFIAEVKSHWAEKEEFDENVRKIVLVSDFEKMIKKLNDHKDKVLNFKEKWSVPDFGYIFLMNIFSDKINVLVMKYFFRRETAYVMNRKM